MIPVRQTPILTRNNFVLFCFGGGVPTMAVYMGHGKASSTHLFMRALVQPLRKTARAGQGAVFLACVDEEIQKKIDPIIKQAIPKLLRGNTHRLLEHLTPIATHSATSEPTDFIKLGNGNRINKFEPRKHPHSIPQPLPSSQNTRVQHQR